MNWKCCDVVRNGGPCPKCGSHPFGSQQTKEPVSPIHIISLGVGVQSSTMALMAAHGEITPMPKYAVFADTGDEPVEIYEYLKYLEPLLPFPVKHIHRSSRGISNSRLSYHIREHGQSQIPSFVMGDNGAGLGKRQCTAHWKIEPLHREFRSIAGIAGKRTIGIQVVGWQGISLDEIIRAKPSRDHWLERRFPLLEKRMRRYNCEDWLRRNGYIIPHKSACVMCPYRSDRQWAASKAKGGEEWAKIVRVSNELSLHGEFLTAECKPIEQCDFSTDEDHGQQVMFGNECEGMCGV